MNEENEMHKDPNNWKLGIFYFNPKDKRIFVLKRIPGLGVTLNFGNPYAVIIFSVMIIIIIFMSRK